MTEPKLIDAIDLKKKAFADPDSGEGIVYVQDIDEAHSVDAVPVVRCKDCKQWQRNCGRTDSPNGHCFLHDIDPNGNDFCSYGERRA